MIGRTLPLSIALALLSSCSTSSSSTDSSLDVAGAGLFPPPEPCGVMQGQFAGLRDRPALVDDLVTPCDPISAAAIEFTCTAKDGELIFDPDHPGSEEHADWTSPDLTVSDAQCRDLNDAGSIVACDFTIADEGRERRVVNQRFRHQYYEEHGPTSHWYSASWFTDRSCLTPRDDEAG